MERNAESRYNRMCFSAPDPNGKHDLYGGRGELRMQINVMKKLGETKDYTIVPFFSARERDFDPSAQIGAATRFNNFNFSAETSSRGLQKAPQSIGGTSANRARSAPAGLGRTASEKASKALRNQRLAEANQAE